MAMLLCSCGVKGFGGHVESDDHAPYCGDCGEKMRIAPRPAPRRLKGFTVPPRRKTCPCLSWAMLMGTSYVDGHHPNCQEQHPRFPADGIWENGDTAKARGIRQLLMRGFKGHLTSRIAPAIDFQMGPKGAHEDHVHIPFTCRNGVVVTLYGGHIHAGPGVTWDVIGPNGSYDDDRFPDGLDCLTTVELVRAIRTL